MKRKLSTAFVGMFFSRDVFALAATVGTAALIIAPAINGDPIPWVIGAAFGTIAQAWLPSPIKKIKHDNAFLTFMNGRGKPLISVGVSIFLAGIGSEYIVRVLQFKEFPAPHLYIVAAVIASVWPMLMHAIWAKFKKWLES